MISSGLHNGGMEIANMVAPWMSSTNARLSKKMRADFAVLRPPDLQEPIGEQNDELNI